MRFQKILCPIDFSEASREAMRVATEFSARLDAPLTLLHVYQPPTYVLPEGSVVLASPEALSDLQRQVSAAMEDWKKTADLDASARGAKPVEVRALQGVAWQEIVRLAEANEYQMIVIGTHGRTGLKRLLLGSVAERVVRSCPCPVLTVHSHEAQ